MVKKLLKIITFLLAFVPSVTTFAFSYGGLPTVILPKVQLLDNSYISPVVAPGNSGNQAQSYYRNFTDTYLEDHVYAKTVQVVELDFSTFTGTSLRPQVILGQFIHDGTIANSYLYLSGTYLYYEIAGVPFDRLQQYIFNVSEFQDIQDMDTGGFYPKKIAFSLHEGFLSYDFVGDDQTFLQDIKVCKYGSNTVCVTKDYVTEDMPYGVRLSYSYTPLTYFQAQGCAGTAYTNCFPYGDNSGYPNSFASSFIPQFKNDSGYYTPMRQDIPQKRMYFQDQTSKIQNPVYGLSGGTLLVEQLSLFYTSTGQVSYTGDTIGGGSGGTGSGNTIFEDCSSYDVSCLFSSFWSYITDSIDGLTSVVDGSGSLFYASGNLLPDYGTGYGAFTPVGQNHCTYNNFYPTSENISNLFRIRSDVNFLDNTLYAVQLPFTALLNPILQIGAMATNMLPPEEGDVVCMLGDLYVVDYQMLFAPRGHTGQVFIPQLEPYMVQPGEQTIFDYLFIIILGVMSIAMIIYYFNLSSS